MIRGLYLSATNMVTQRRRMDIVTNNISNVETSGYRGNTLISRSFDDLMLHRVGDPAVLRHSPSIGPLNTGVHIDEVVTNFTQGRMEQTERPTDMAIEGDGFFVVSTAAGDRYTRDGGFTITNDGYLVNCDGHYVMGENGRIFVGDDQFNVALDGTITRSDESYAGQLRIVRFDDLTGLRQTGNNLFINYSNQPVRVADDVDVRQNFLENSNVDMTIEMVQMLNLYRSYETSQRMVKMMDESLSKAVNEVGRV